jgi:hypothetical protein
VEGSGRGLFKTLSWDLPGGTEKTQENLSVIAVLAEIRTADLPNRRKKDMHVSKLPVLI